MWEEGDISVDRSRVFQQSGRERAHTHNFKIKKKNEQTRDFSKNFLHNQQNLNCKMILVSFCVVLYHWHWFQLTSDCNGKGAREHIETRKLRARLSIFFPPLFSSCSELHQQILIVLSLTLVSGVDNFQTQYKFL